jgi:NTE family protein
VRFGIGPSRLQGSNFASKCGKCCNATNLCFNGQTLIDASRRSSMPAKLQAPEDASSHRSTGALPTRKATRQPLALALQGGGIWGAYTWGVLDYVLAQADIDITDISGTSAGALNGAIVAAQLATGSRKSARDALKAFWNDVAADHEKVAIFVAPWVTAWFQRALADGTLSPYDVNPLDVNPLRSLVEKHVSIDALADDKSPRLTITATHVATGLPRVFFGGEITVDALMASACVPTLFRAVEIDGEAYWDGAFCGNPTLWPLFRTGRPKDVLLVQLSPDVRPGAAPRTSAEITRRSAEITFHNSLVGELQALHTMRQLTSDDVGHETLTGSRLHRVGPPPIDLLDEHRAGVGTVQRETIGQLCRRGRADARKFFTQHRDALGKTSTLDLGATFFSTTKPKLKAAA